VFKLTGPPEIPAETPAVADTLGPVPELVAVVAVERSTVVVVAASCS
jgi:hypothetical protein